MSDHNISLIFLRFFNKSTKKHYHTKTDWRNGDARFQVQITYGNL